MAEDQRTHYDIALFPQGYKMGCKHCRRILVSGRALIRVFKPNDPTEYWLSRMPPVFCCGEDKKFPELFDSFEEAQKRLEEILNSAGADGVIHLQLTAIQRIPRHTTN